MVLPCRTLVKMGIEGIPGINTVMGKSSAIGLAYVLAMHWPENISVLFLTLMLLVANFGNTK